MSVQPTANYASTFPLLPLRGAVLFPGATVPFEIGRPKTVALAEHLIAKEPPFVVVFAQRVASVDDPGPATCTSTARSPASSASRSSARAPTPSSSRAWRAFACASMETSTPFLEARVEPVDRSRYVAGRRGEALSMSLRDIAKQVIQLMPELPREAASLIDSIQAPGALADFVAANLDAPVDEKASSSRRST